MRRIKYAFAGMLAAAAGIAGVPVPEVRLGAPIWFENTGVHCAAAVGDVTGDGHNDIVTTAGRMTILPGNGDGTIGTVNFVLPDSAAASRPLLAKLNDDGVDDIVISHGGAPRTHVFLSDGAGGLTETVYGPEGNFKGLDAGRDAALADWDGDGDVDIVSAGADGTNGRICVRLNLGQGVFSENEEKYPIPVFNANVRFGAAASGRLLAIVAADLDADGDVDIAGLPAGGATVQILLRDADGVLVAQPPLRPADETFPWIAGAPVAADVDGDGLLDLVVPGRATKTTSNTMMPNTGVLVYRHASDETFVRSQVLVSGRAIGFGAVMPQVAVADLNGDGRHEIASAAAYFLNDGTGTFGAAVALPAGFSVVAAGNFDGEPHPDLVCFAPHPTLRMGVLIPSVLPVLTAGAPPAPEVERVASGPLTVGTTGDVVVLGSGFHPGVTADFGADVKVNEIERESETKVRVNVTVLRTAFPGVNEGSFTNPGSSPAPFEFPVLVGGTATVSGLLPSEARAGETLDVVVRGNGSVEGAVAALGEGATVTAVEALDDGGFQMKVALGLTAPVGPHDLTIDNGSGVRTVAPAAFTVLPRRSIDITPTQGVLTMHPRAGRGSFTVRGTIAFDPAMAGGSFDPATETTVVGFGLANLPSVVEIAPDAGWRVRGKRATWKSGKHATNNVTVEIDLTKKTFRIDAKNLTLLPQSGTEVLVEATLGDETGATVRTWKRKRGSGNKVLVLK